MITKMTKMANLVTLWILTVALVTTNAETQGSGSGSGAGGSGGPVHHTPPPLTIETTILGFRLWMIIGLIVLVFLVLIIILCCAFKCRIPRTKQQINADYDKKQLINKMKKRNKMQAKMQAYAESGGRPGAHQQFGTRAAAYHAHAPQRGRDHPQRGGDPQQRGRDHPQRQLHLQHAVPTTATPLAAHPAEQNRKPMATLVGGPPFYPGQKGASRTLAAFPPSRHQRT